MADLFTGTVDKSSVFNRAPSTENLKKEKDKIVAPPGGNLKDPDASSPDDSFMQAMEAAQEAQEAGMSGDPFIDAIDAGNIDLSNLDYQMSGKDMTLMGKFDRLKFLRSLRKDGRITPSRYITLKRGIALTIEEAALLEAKEIGRPVDPDEIKSDPILMNKYGFMELDAELADSIEELQEAGVDVTAGAPANIRKEVGRQSGEEAKLNALNELRDQGQILHYKPSKLGMIITIPTIDGPQDLLLDELGLDGKDFLDMISEVPGIATNIAAVAGAVIAAPGLAAGGVISLAGLSVISGISYFAGASASDLINRHFTKNQIYALDQIVQKRGPEAAIAAGIDFLLLGGVKIGKGVLQKFIGPVAGSGDLAVKNYLKSIASGKQVIQYNQQGKIIFNKDGSPKMGDIQLTPGLFTQSPTIQRIEGIAEKIPGGADVLKTQKEIIEKQLSELQQRAKGIEPKIEKVDIGAGKTEKKVVYPDAVKTSEEIGEEVSEFASRSLAKDEAIITHQRNVIKTEADQALDNVASSLSSTGSKVVKTKEAGDLIIDGVKKSRNNYVDEYNKIEAKMKELPNYKGDMKLDTTDINSMAKKLEESFPTKTTSTSQTKPPYGNIIETKTILPKQLKGGILDDLKNVNNLSVDQAMKYKKMLQESYSGETIPTEADQLITKIVNGLDNKISEAFVSQGPEVIKTYNRLLRYEANNGGIFTNPIISKILKDGSQAENVIVPAILQGDAAAIRAFETALGADNAILADVKSAAFNEMLRKARSSLGADSTNPQVLSDQISNLPESVQKFLLGKDYKKVKNLLNVLAGERGIVSIEQLSAMGGNLVNKLKKVIALERTAEKNWRNKILKPFLKNEIDETAVNPAEFTRHLLNTGTTDEIIKTMNKFSPGLKENIRKRVIQEILESGRSADADLILKEFASGQTPPHPTLYKALFKIGKGDEALARNKLTAILGNETLDLLEDIAGIQAGRRVTSDVAASAGGLISGSILNNLMNLRLGNAASLVKYRIAAKILSSTGGRAWLTSQKQLPSIGMKTSGISVASKEIFDLVSEEFENEPELKKIAIQALEDNNREYKERAKEDKEYNEKVLQNYKPMEERNVAPTVPVDTAPAPVENKAEAISAPTVNSASRLASAFNPAGMQGMPTGNINPNTMAKGAALFNKPGEITFAAQGGIMNARKPIQRVA